MSGLYSRRKGLKNEYQVRDALRAEGFQADRVPSSGAAEGFKGDIRFGQDGRSYLAEVKVRAGTSFKSIYELYSENQIGGVASLCIPTPEKLWCVDIADSMSKLMGFSTFYKNAADKRTKVVLKVHEFLKECDFLVLRNDRMPWLYLRYRK